MNTAIIFPSDQISCSTGLSIFIPKCVELGYGGLGYAPPGKFFWKYNAPRWLLRHFLGLKTSLGSLHFSPDHMHVDWCPSASAVSGTPVEPGEEVVHKSQWIFCYSGSYSEQHLTRMSDHCTHNLLVLRSLQFSFTLGPQSSCGHKPVIAICVFLYCKQRVGNIISVKTLVGDCQVC